jgi:N-acetylneuraminic acid mutarotase
VQGIPGFSIGNYGYAGLGATGTHYPDELWRFDPSMNSWTKRAPFPGRARVEPACFVICDKAYLVCGSISNGGTCLNECWECNGTNNTWTQKANFPGPIRTYAVGFAIDSLGYVGTGANELNDFRKDFYAYHPSTNIWTKIADFLGTARDGDCGFGSNGKGYVCFGQDSTLKQYKDIWEYNPGTNLWTQKNDYPGSGILIPNGFVICNNIYVGSGDTASAYYLDHRFWKYNTTSDLWTQETSVAGITTIESAAFAINDTGYYGFGMDRVGVAVNKFNKFFAGDTCDNITCITEGYQVLHAYSELILFPTPTMAFSQLRSVMLPANRRVQHRKQSLKFIM